MDLGLKERVAIVGGSSRGIGRAVALALTREGASVTICGRNETDLRRAEIELARIGSQHHVLAIPADLSQIRDIRRVARDTFNRFGQVGILVTHLGDAPPGRASELNDETIIAALENNFLSALRLAREALPYMKQQRWGRIIHLMPGELRRSGDGATLSAATQNALISYYRALASELAAFNITVNTVRSGPIQTDYLTASIEALARQQNRPAQELTREALAEIPMRRMGKPEEISDLVAFLASERAGYMTGATVVMDGGKLVTG